MLWTDFTDFQMQLKTKKSAKANKKLLLSERVWRFKNYYGSYCWRYILHYFCSENLKYLWCSSFSEVRNFRSSCPEVLLGKDVVKICSKFTREHPCRSVILIILWSFVDVDGIEVDVRTVSNLKCQSIVSNQRGK